MFHRHPVLSLLTGGYLALVAWITLTPQAYAADRIAIIYRILDALHRRGYLLSIDDRRMEFLANIALFVPVGCSCCCSSAPACGGSRCWRRSR